MVEMQPIYAERRRRLLQAIEPAVMILPAAPLAIRNNDVEHEYRQDSDVFYLTGFDEPECVVVLRSGAPEPFVLFVRPRDPEREVWDGARAGVDGALKDYGANVAHPIGELADKLPDLIQNTQRLYYRFGRNRSFDEIVLGALERVRGRAKQGTWAPSEIVDPAAVLHEMRLFKSKEELDLMRRAVEITRDAHVEAMQKTRPGMYEFEVEALLRASFRKHGAERTAYQPIVGSGPNATVLHYRKNDRQMRDGDLLLIDAGCEYGYYASDVTRTFPVGGRWGSAQREIYEIVLEAQLASIAAVRPGATLDDVHRASVKVIAAGLIRLGLLSGSLDHVIEEQTYKTYYMHRTSHYIGMDVHDVGSYFEPASPFQPGTPRPLASGMVITVEPGIYIAESAQAPERYRGIGVRIEDDVLVGPEGPVVLSDGIPKQPEDVERACAG
jgi:Xaa-Pro aminopeptidase